MKSVFLIAITLLCGSVMAQYEPPPKLMKAINSELAGNGFLSGLKSQNLRKFYKLDSTFTLSQVTLGPITLYYTLTDKMIKEYHKGDPIKTLMTGRITWSVLLMFKGKQFGSISFMQDDTASWKATSMSTVSEIDGCLRVCETWPKEKGYHPIFFSYPDFLFNYFYIPEKEFCNLTPYFDDSLSRIDNSIVDYKILTTCDKSMAVIKETFQK